MSTKQQSQLITVSIFEGVTDKQVSFCEKMATDAPFFVAASCLESHVEKIRESKPPGAKEIFSAYFMVNHDYPVRIDFEVSYGPASAATRANKESGTAYAFRWIVPEDIDAFPFVDFHSGGPKLVLRDCPQVERFCSYENINRTFENRVRCRLDRKLGFYVEPKLPGEGDVGQDWETIDFVIRLAKGDNLEQVARAMDEANKHGRENSLKEVKETVELLARGCSDEISILRTIYEMEGNQADCSDIVAEARAMLRDYDRRNAPRKLVT